MTEPKRQHGGPRANSGGARPGAGRPKSEPALLPGLPANDDPLQWLLALMACTDADLALRADAAKAVLPYCHAKKGNDGSKDTKQQAAKKAASGKFGASPPPLRSVK